RMPPDGRTVVATSNGLSGPEAVVMVKVGPDGKVDASFQEDGFAAASVYYAYLHALALAPDGKIVGVGQAAIEGGGQAWLIARFDAGGSLDTTFGTNGTIVEPMPGYSAAWAVSVQPDGAIVVGGAREGDIGYVQHWALARFDV